MKKNIQIMAVLTLFLVLLLTVGCQGRQDTETPDTGDVTETATEVATEPYTEIETEAETETEAVTEGETEPEVVLLPGITDVEQDGYRPAYNLGHNKKLEGTPVVVLLFINDSVSTWDALEVRDFKRDQVMPALYYIERKAKTYGVTLDFQVETYAAAWGDVGLAYDGRVNPDIYNGGSDKDILDKAGNIFDEETNWGVYSYFKAKYPDDEIIFLTFFDKAGYSYTRRVVSTGHCDYAEHSVIFSRPYGTLGKVTAGSRSSTVANHLLRLFGAMPLYSTESQEAISQQYYPHDIMLWTYPDIRDNQMGAYTAFALGWTNEVPDICFEDAFWQ